MTAIALVAVDTADGNQCKLFEIGDDETDCITRKDLWSSALACSKNCPPFGAVTGVAAKLGSPSLAATDAPGGVQRIDLRPVLTRLLLAHTPREIE